MEKKISCSVCLKLPTCAFKSTRRFLEDCPCIQCIVLPKCTTYCTPRKKLFNQYLEYKNEVGNYQKAK